MKKEIFNLIDDISKKIVKKAVVFEYSELNTPIGYAIKKSEAIELKKTVDNEMNEIKKEYLKEKIYILK